MITIWILRVEGILLSARIFCFDFVSKGLKKKVKIEILDLSSIFNADYKENTIRNIVTKSSHKDD